MNERDAGPLPAPEQASNNFAMRVVAALVLAPLTIATAYVGGVFWTALVTLVSIGLFLEWLTVVGAARVIRITVSGSVALAVAGWYLAAGQLGVSLAALAVGFAAVVLLSPEQRRWSAAGFLYAVAALLASVLVRLDQTQGLVALIFVLLVVWITDIGGYFAGRGLGGPKLWPRVSPKKTWAGAFGGFAGSLAIAAGFVAFGFGKPLPLLLSAAILSVASQLGDLFESAVKRRFGVKDSSHIIPGHGGLLDRLDGFVAAIVLAAIFGILRGGVDGVGRALMVW